MARGIQVPVIADVSSAVRGVSSLADAFDDNVDALVELGRQGDRAGDQVERAIDGASDAGETFERRLRRAFDTVSTQSRQASNDVGDNARRGFREAEDAAERFGDVADREGNRASETTEEFRDEARANFSEVASSFQGDMTSATDLVQGTLGGLAGSIPGGLGLALGGLAAVAGTFAARWQQAAEETKERIGDMYDDMVESGNDFLSESAIQQGIRKILLDEEGRAASYATAMQIAKVSGLELAVVLRALAGDQQANALTQAELGRAVEEGERAFDAARESGEDYNELLQDTNGINGYINLLQRQSGEFDTAAGKADAAREATTEWDDTLRNLPRDVRTQLGLTRDIATEQEARAAYDGLGRPISPTVKPRLDTSDLDRQIRSYVPPRVLVSGEFAVRGGQRMV